MASYLGRATGKTGFGSAGSGSGSTVDPVARALAKLDTAEAGESIAPATSVWGAGRTWANNTAAAITVPASVDATSMAAAGFTDVTEANAADYSRILTAADTTLAATDTGALALSDTNAVVVRIPTGLPIGTERKFSRLGANNVDLYVGTGAVEIIDGSPDGAIRINEDGDVTLKKVSATAWRTVSAAVVGASASATPSAVPIQRNAATISATPSAINFTGAGVAVTDVSGVATVNITGAAATTMAASGVSHSGGLVPDPGATAGTTRFLCENATFAVPPNGLTDATFDALTRLGNSTIDFANDRIAIQDASANTINYIEPDELWLTDAETSLGIGTGSLPKTSTGANNTALGINALSGFATQTDSVAIGFEAGSGAGQGSVLTLIGRWAGRNNTASNLTSVGAYAGQSNTGNRSTGLGYAAGYQNTGDSLAAVGYQAGYQNTGTNSTFVGGFSGYANSGASSVGLGSSSVEANTGANVTSVGHSSGRFNIGANVTSLGQGAAFANLAPNVTAVGYSSGRSASLGAAVAISAFTASTLTVTGHGFGANGSKVQVVIGGTTAPGGLALSTAYVVTITDANTITFPSSIQITSAGTSATAAKNTLDQTNCSMIGANSAATGANQIVLGDANITALRCQVTSITALSDARDKSNVQDMPLGLDFVMGLRPVTFDWSCRDGSKAGQKDSGFIAQELASAEDDANAADWLKLTLRVDPEKLEASPGRLVPVLVKAIQDLKTEFDAYKATHP